MERIIKVINDYRPDAGFLDNSFSCDIRRRPAGREVRVVSNLDIFSGKDKTEIAIERIKAFEPSEGYYVAFSGGKDSVVILDLVKRANVKFDAHYNITGIDPPEL